MSDSAPVEVEQTALALAPAPSQRAVILADSLKADTEQRKLLALYMRDHMREGTDFGTIPGTPKPTLLKPGAEKLVDLFRCTPKFALLKDVEDFERGHGFFNYMFRVRLVSRDSNSVLAEGFGSANSREGRYRWRNSNRKCPACSKEAIIQGKAEYGGGWICFKKKGGCGAKYGDTDPAIVAQPQGQVENEDIATLANTILKMAKKRAMVDGAIALARCSDMFTQDVEDFADHAPPDDVPPPPIAPLTKQSPPPTGKRTAEVKAQLSARASQIPLTSPAGRAATGKPADTTKKMQIQSEDWFQRIRNLGASFGKEGKALSEFCKGVGVTKSKPETFTAADFERVAGALKALHPAATEEPPPPGDADAPWMGDAQ